MSCTNCGSAFHEKWACTKPLKVAEEAISTPARMDVQRRPDPSAATRRNERASGLETAAHVAGEKRKPEAGTQALRVDTKKVRIKTTKVGSYTFVAALDPIPDSALMENIYAPKRGRPKTITDMRTYKADKAKQYRALAKAKTTD